MTVYYPEALFLPFENSKWDLNEKYSDNFKKAEEKLVLKTHSQKSYKLESGPSFE